MLNRSFSFRAPVLPTLGAVLLLAATTMALCVDDRIHLGKDVLAGSRGSNSMLV